MEWAITRDQIVKKLEEGSFVKHFQDAFQGNDLYDRLYFWPDVEGFGYQLDVYGKNNQLLNTPENIESFFWFNNDGECDILYKSLVEWQPNYQGHGLSRALEAAENAIARDCRIPLFVMSAENEGRWIWPKKYGYRFRKDFFDESWVRKQLESEMGNQDYLTLGLNAGAYPKHVLESFRQIRLEKDTDWRPQNRDRKTRRR